MTEDILATGQIRTQIIAELQDYREQYAHAIREMHPHVSFLPLSVLATHSCYASLIDQTLFHKAITLLGKRLHDYGLYSLLDPARVWVGIAMDPCETCFGGFHHPDQGYRYLQQMAITSLSGALSGHPVDRMLATLELIRAYSHDTLHYNSYRLFCATPQPKKTHFYRLQYGINFRRWDDTSYSAKDPVHALTTRNLGNIMEGATDRFAHQVTRSLAQEMDNVPRSTYSHPSWENAAFDLISSSIYRDCTGQMTQEDIRHLREMERGIQPVDISQNARVYLKSMRLFVQYVNVRYQRFLAEFDPENPERLHNLIIESMVSGKMKELCSSFDAALSRRRGFVHLFKSSTY